MGHCRQCLLPQAAEDRSSGARPSCPPHWLTWACPGSATSVEGLGWGCQSGARSIYSWIPRETGLGCEMHNKGLVESTENVLKDPNTQLALTTCKALL